MTHAVSSLGCDTPSPSAAPATSTERGSTLSPTLRQVILELASRNIVGPREASYGPPAESFTVIAGFWNTYLAAIKGRDLQAHDIGAMMTLFKLARVAASDGKHLDSWVDAAGYSACGAECAAPCNKVDESTPA